MPATLHIDTSHGISGDLVLGALCALGLRPSALEWELSRLPLGDFHMHFDRVGEGIRFTIHEGATHTHAQEEGECCHDHGHEHQDEPHDHEQHEQHEHHDHHGHDHGEGECGCGHHHHHHAHEEGSRTVGEITALINGSELSPYVRERATAILDRIAAVVGPARLSAESTLVLVSQVVGTCLGLETLGVTRVTASPLRESREGGDAIALAILGETPVERVEGHHELISPVGAAILAGLVDEYTPMPSTREGKTGVGVGRPRSCSHPPATLTLRVSAVG